MNYPEDFDIKTFPAGKTIACSRLMAIVVSVVFFLIIACCVFMLLCGRFKQNYPFVISVDSITNDWSVLTYPDKDNDTPVESYQIMQEMMLVDYIKHRFTITPDMESNEQRWKKCEINECDDSTCFNPNNNECAIYCLSSQNAFESFTNSVVPQYINNFQNGEYWIPKPNMLITPMKLTEKSSEWQIIAEIESNIKGSFNVLIFVNILQDIKHFPATMGYYINSFSAYKYEIYKK
ncbi:MAG: hypothetical protein MJ158_02835 [Alphaproteobacteria bacterium]|nr:hypothetical protein [Alphaproteobacteria bacterium]